MLEGWSPPHCVAPSRAVPAVHAVYVGAVRAVHAVYAGAVHEFHAAAAAATAVYAGANTTVWIP